MGSFELQPFNFAVLQMMPGGVAVKPQNAPFRLIGKCKQMPPDSEQFSFDELDRTKS